MKYCRVLCILLALCLCGASMGGSSAYAVSMDLEDESITDIRSEIDLQYYPFVYTEDEGFALFREVIGDCSSCIPGYLYVQDWNTREIWKVLDEPVTLYRMDGDTLYCIVDGNRIVRTDYFGSTAEEIYKSTYGDISLLECFDGALTFSDGGHVIRFDLTNPACDELLFCDNLTYLFPIADSKIEWSCNDEDVFILDYTKNTTETTSFARLPLVESKNEVNEIVAPFNISENVTFPLPEYPDGSYFTDNGMPCEDHKHCSYLPDGCNCKVYRSPIQCLGFAKYAFDRYANLYPSNRSWYSQNDPHVIVKRATLSSDADVQILLNKLKYGAYMRLTRPSGDYAIGDHSVVIASSGASSTVTCYEGNVDGQCEVKMVKYTLASFRAKFPFVIHGISHDFSSNPTIYSARSHMRHCTYSGCEGYILESHYFVTSGDKKVCKFCGYSDQSPIPVPVG